MKEQNSTTQAVLHHSQQALFERREVSRVPITFGLMYSGINQHGSLMADGMVTDLSRDGLSFQGSCPVRVGMELSMLLYLPDGSDPLFILETRVIWSSQNNVGVEFTKLNLREGNRLLSFLRTQSALQMQPVGH